MQICPVWVIFHWVGEHMKYARLTHWCSIQSNAVRLDFKRSLSRLSRQSRNFPGQLKTFQTIRKLSRQSGNSFTSISPKSSQMQKRFFPSNSFCQKSLLLGSFRLFHHCKIATLGQDRNFAGSQDSGCAFPNVHVDSRVYRSPLWKSV